MPHHAMLNRGALAAMARDLNQLEKEPSADKTAETGRAHAEAPAEGYAARQPVLVRGEGERVS